MGIALLALSDLFTPLQSLAGRWISPRGGPGRRPATVDLQAELRYVQVRPGSTGAHAPAAEARPAVRPSRPLRVVRVAEAGTPRATGRVLLSGRMEDVCAELDRLASLESAQAGRAAGTRLH